MSASLDDPVPAPSTPSASDDDAGGGSPSTTDVAQSEAAKLGQSAAQAGNQVVSTAADQAREVVLETRRQGNALLEQSRAAVREQALRQQQDAAQRLSSLAEELRGLLDGTGTSPEGPVHDLLQQASGLVEDLAGWLHEREPADLLEEVRSFARRKPGSFLLGAGLAGVLAGRLTRGVRDVHADTAPRPAAESHGGY